MLIVIGFGGAVVTLLVVALLAVFKVDGFHGDRRRDMPVATPVTLVERPAPMPRGSIRVTAERVTQVEAA